MRVPPKLNLHFPALRHEEDLACVRIFHFSTWRIAFHINFPRVGRVRTDHPSRFTRHLAGNGVVLGLRRCHRRGRRKSIRWRRLLRFGLRCMFGDRAYGGRGWARDGAIAVAIASTRRFRPAGCLTSNQRHTKSGRSQKNKVTNHRGNVSISNNSSKFE